MASAMFLGFMRFFNNLQLQYPTSDQHPNRINKPAHHFTSHQCYEISRNPGRMASYLPNSDSRTSRGQRSLTPYTKSFAIPPIYQPFPTPKVSTSTPLDRNLMSFASSLSFSGLSGRWILNCSGEGPHVRFK